MLKRGTIHIPIRTLASGRGSDPSPGARRAPGRGSLPQREFEVPKGPSASIGEPLGEPIGQSKFSTCQRILYVFLDSGQNRDFEVAKKLT